MSTTRSQQSSRLAIAIVLLASILFISLASVRPANANVIGKRSEESASYSTSTDELTTLRSTTSSFFSRETQSLSPSFTSETAATTSKTRTTTSGPSGDARKAAAAVSSSGPLSTFCRAFVSQCYKTALSGQSGEVTISHSCQRDGNKYSDTFTYSCARGTEKLTAKVLKAMGWAYHRPATTETIERLLVVTEGIEDVVTTFDRTTSFTTSTDATITSTISTHITNIETHTVPSTVTSTTIIPRTFSTTSTATLVQTATETSTVLTSTATEVFIRAGEIPIYQATLADTDEHELFRRAPSTFCLAFRIACQNECQRVDSREDVEICDSSKSPTYTMACICRNGKRETQHALEAVAEDRKIVSVTKTSTTTTYFTSTKTTTLPTQMLRTRLVTRTSLVPVTGTSYTTTTATLGETTHYTGVPSLAATDVRSTTRTTTTTTTSQVPGTTTRIVLASTGYIHAFDTTSGEDIGTLGYASLTSYFQLIPSGTTGTAINFMAVRDPPTGLYQLMQLDDPHAVLIQRPEPGFPIFRSGSAAFAAIYSGQVDQCGTNGGSAGPVETPTAACETFIHSPLALDPTPGATMNTVNLRPFYINPSSSTPANHTGVWGFWTDTSRILMHVADKEAYLNTYPTSRIVFPTLRFPFAAA